MTFLASFVIQFLAILPLARRRRLLHDILSGTVVVRARALTESREHRIIPRGASTGTSRGDWPYA